jgi:protease-4
MTQEQVFEIAEGRVWLGTQANQIGLVDSCGGLLSAIAYAKDIAGLGQNYQIVELLDMQDQFAVLMNSLSAEAKQALYEAMHIDGVMEEFESLKSILTTQGVYTYCPYNIEFK